MTVEESKSIWKIEKANLDKISVHIPSLVKLYSKVDELIESGELLYDQFTNDMIDETTTMIINNTKEAEEPDRITQINQICNALYDKYTKQHNDAESREGDSDVSTDCVEVLE